MSGDLIDWQAGVLDRLKARGDARLKREAEAVADRLRADGKEAEIDVRPPELGELVGDVAVMVGMSAPGAG